MVGLFIGCTNIFTSKVSRNRFLYSLTHFQTLYRHIRICSDRSKLWQSCSYVHDRISRKIETKVAIPLRPARKFKAIRQHRSGRSNSNLVYYKISHFWFSIVTILWMSSLSKILGLIDIKSYKIWFRTRNFEKVVYTFQRLYRFRRKEK